MGNKKSDAKPKQSAPDKEDAKAKKLAAARALPKLGYSLEEFSQVASMSRSAIYKAIAAGSLQTYKAGRRRLVSARAAQAFIAKLEAASQAPSGAQ